MFQGGLNVMSEHKHQTSSYKIHQVTHGGEDADKAINFTTTPLKCRALYRCQEMAIKFLPTFQ